MENKNVPQRAFLFSIFCTFFWLYLNNENEKEKYSKIKIGVVNNGNIKYKTKLFRIRKNL